MEVQNLHNGGDNKFKTMSFLVLAFKCHNNIIWVYFSHCYENISIQL